MLIRAKGDIFDYDHQALAHGVSNKGFMGRGIAAEFKRRYPDMFSQYKRMCKRGELEPGDVFLYEEDQEAPKVFNLVTQNSLEGANKEYLARSLQQMYVLAKEKGINDIAMPEIGCGLGRLDISDLEKALQPFTNDSKTNVTIYSR